MEARGVFLLMIGVINLISSSGASFNCYSCSYIRSTKPEVGYGCVSSPANVTRGQPVISCQAPYMCATKASLASNHIRSLTRGCLPQQEVCSGDTCCDGAGLYPSCEHKCRSDLCNSLNGEMWLTTDTDNNDGKNGAAKYTVTTQTAMVACACAVLLLIEGSP